MTAGELMVALSKVARGAPVMAWDEVSAEYKPVVDIVWDDDGNNVYITTEQTD